MVAQSWLGAYRRRGRELKVRVEYIRFAGGPGGLLSGREGGGQKGPVSLPCRLTPLLQVVASTSEEQAGCIGGQGSWREGLEERSVLLSDEDQASVLGGCYCCCLHRVIGRYALAEWCVVSDSSVKTGGK